MKYILLLLLALVLNFNINAQNSGAYVPIDTHIDVPVTTFYTYSSTDTFYFETAPFIKFTNFKVKGDTLYWEIENPENIDYFELYSSTDGYIWRYIDSTSAGKDVYNCELECTGETFTYYKIKAVKESGSYIYSSVIVEQHLNDYIFYFTPTSISVVGDYEFINLYDIHGYEIDLDTYEDLPAGSYVLIIDNEIYTIKK